jgi:hypothetical protein
MILKLLSAYEIYALTVYRSKVRFKIEDCVVLLAQSDREAEVRGKFEAWLKEHDSKRLKELKHLT